MKTLKAGLTVLILSIISLAVSGPLFAENTAEEDAIVTELQNDDKLFKKFEKSLLYGLSSDVRGVVESTLYNTIAFKIAHPEFDSKRVLEGVSRIAQEGENHNLRYKAYLVVAYYLNQDQFEAPDVLAEIADNKDHDKIFFYLQNELQSDQFTSN